MDSAKAVPCKEMSRDQVKVIIFYEIELVSSSFPLKIKFQFKPWIHGRLLPKLMELLVP